MHALTSCKKALTGVLLGLSLVSGITVQAEKSTVINAEPAPTTTENSKVETISAEASEVQEQTEEKEAEATTEVAAWNTEEEETDEADENVTNGWNKKKTSYYKNGQKVTGWNAIDGKLYYFSKKGKLYTKTGMNAIEDQTYYFSDEHYVLSGVIEVDDKSYYFQKKGGARYEEPGVSKVDDTYYCIKDDYSLKKGWYRDEDNKRYYFDKKTYAGLTGWNYVGKYKYYFNDKGRLVQDVRKKLTKSQKKSYKIKVNRTASCVTVYAKDGLKGYTIPVVAFICSAGKETPTGSFTIKDKLRWHELMGPCWGQWCMHLTVDILFHSVYYDKDRDNKSLNVNAYNKLGTMASHGCVRMQAGDCKWIYDNCDVGTKVVIYNNKNNPGPLDKPEIEKLSSDHTWDPTDPAFN